jgi:bifunctional UDP-N-acetylglucosamine pyrophosphorylase / glucosamine-1-phosphate N-acetyltransferase
MDYSNTRAIILAAGKSTRFKTKKTKLLYNICGRKMILYLLKELESLDIPITLVLGYQSNEVRKEVESSKIKNVDFVVQDNPLGTGHAISCSQKTWKEDSVLILCGDTPLIKSDLIKRLFLEHKQNNADMTFCYTHVLNPTGYGRIVEDGKNITIVEEKNCTEEQQHINKINSGIYLISSKLLKENIDRIEKNSVTGEYHFGDIVNLACDKNLKVHAMSVPYDSVRGVNNLQELWEVEQVKRSEFIKYWMSEGVRFELAQSIHIDVNVKIGAGSFIGTGVHLLGKTEIGEECFVAAFSILENTKIGNNCNIHSHSVIQNTVVGNNAHVGPFARLRNNVSVGNNVQIGNFVEIKNSTIDDNSRTKHLTYLGNANIGKSVNIGAGTITCNYDGVNKNKTTIEDNVFIGSNNTLIAPIVIKRGAYTAGGSTINEDVPENSLAIGRAKQQCKKNYSNKLLNQIKEKGNSSKSKKTKKKSEENQSSFFKAATKTTTVISD